MSAVRFTFSFLSRKRNDAKFLPFGIFPFAFDAKNLRSILSNNPFSQRLIILPFIYVWKWEGAKFTKHDEWCNILNWIIFVVRANEKLAWVRQSKQPICFVIWILAAGVKPPFFTYMRKKAVVGIVIFYCWCNHWHENKTITARLTSISTKFINTFRKHITS